MSGEKINC